MMSLSITVIDLMKQARCTDYKDPLYCNQERTGSKFPLPKCSTV